MHALCVLEGNVYLLGAAGHQALLQPECLLLGAGLGMVVPHQAPLDLEMTEQAGSRLGMWAALCPLLSHPTQHSTPHLLPDVFSALRSAAVCLGDVAHREGHEAKCVVAVGHSGTSGWGDT